MNDVYTRERIQAFADRLSTIPGMTPGNAMTVASGLLGRPDPVMKGLGGSERVMDEDYVEDLVFRFDFFLHNRIGWYSRDGRMMGCAYAAHERLCRYFGFDEKELEAEGWARVSPNGYQCRWRLSPKQRRKVTELGLAIDRAAELAKPAFPAAPPSASPSP